MITYLSCDLLWLWLPAPRIPAPWVNSLHQQHQVPEKSNNKSWLSQMKSTKCMWNRLICTWSFFLWQPASTEMSRAQWSVHIRTKGVNVLDHPIGLPDDVSQHPELDQTAHHPHPPVPHQHLAGGLILKEEVREGVGDLALHLLPADPQRRGSLGPVCTETPRIHFSPGCLHLTSSWVAKVRYRLLY